MSMVAPSWFESCWGWVSWVCAIAATTLYLGGIYWALSLTDMLLVLSRGMCRSRCHSGMEQVVHPLQWSVWLSCEGWYCCKAVRSNSLTVTIPADSAVTVLRRQCRLQPSRIRHKRVVTISRCFQTLCHTSSLPQARVMAWNVVASNSLLNLVAPAEALIAYCSMGCYRD